MAELQNILITGAASGIGRATAIRMARRMHVIAADRDRDGAAALVEELKRDGHSASAVAVDVASRASVAEMMAWIGANVGPVHALFSNAGINLRHPIEEITEEEWDRMMAVHPKGAYLCCQAVLPQMIARKSGAIVTTSSDFAVQGVAGYITYTAAKAAIYSLTKSLAVEFAAHGIRVNAVGPGPIDTPLLRFGRPPEEWGATLARNASRVPMGRLGRPEEVASLVDFLVSERSSYITGQIIHPNGGALMW